jgi:membrane protein
VASFQASRSTPTAGALLAIVLLLARRLSRRDHRDALGDPASLPGATKPGAAMPRLGWWATLKRTWTAIGDDNISIVAGGVAFYALLSIFPAFTALVALYGLIADPGQVEGQLSALEGFLPPEATKLLSEQLQSLTQAPKTGIGIGLAVSVVLALWSARAGTGALMTALDIAYGERETRSLVKFNMIAFGMTAAMIIFGIIALLLVAVIPAILRVLPLPESLAYLISFARWPILALCAAAALALLYRYGPSRREPRWRWVSWGSGVATAFWIIASIGFSIYVAKFADYNKTYGSLGAVVILLMWFYISAYIFLAGAELSAELECQATRRRD